MLEKIRNWPVTVQLSIVVLFLVWCFLLTIGPFVMATFTVIGLVLAALIRIVRYFAFDE